MRNSGLSTEVKKMFLFGVISFILLQIVSIL